jgi:cytochrome c556
MVQTMQSLRFDHRPLGWVGAGAVCIVSLTAWLTTAAAQSDAIRLRQEILAGFGRAVKEPGTMLRQEAPFDLTVVQTSLKTLADGAPKLKSLFPDDSKSGAYTEALPTIWEGKDDFLRIIEQLSASAIAAKAAIKDEATFRSEWGKVSSNCRACHKVYRVLPKT